MKQYILSICTICVLIVGCGSSSDDSAETKSTMDVATGYCFAIADQAGIEVTYDGQMRCRELAVCILKSCGGQGRWTPDEAKTCFEATDQATIEACGAQAQAAYPENE